MKLANSNKSTVASQGVMGSSGFAISNSAHMFRILSDGLYSDKIAAVLREIGCNANDAHIMCGKADQPFEVKLPSRFDSTFHIKDFGPGLDDTEVRELYTTYGWSSKQTSNEVTGAFGLGSKSPFAYTDSFSICAVKDGVKRVYTAHKDDEDKPVVSLLSESPSDEDWQAGVMVTFPVPPEDVNEFVGKASKIFRWFKVKPNILGASLRLEEPKFKTCGANFAIGAIEDQDMGPRVVMANVAYPLNASRLDHMDDLSQAILGCNVHLFMPTGSVMPTPNREDLQYDKQSKPAIAAALRAAAETVAREIYDRVNEQKASQWQWHRNIREYAESLPSAIRYKIRSFLELVSKDAAELKELTQLFDEATCTVPTWVGSGRDAPRIPLKRDANGALLKDATTGQPVFDMANYDKRGCRVWYYWVDRNTRGTNPIKRKEVIGGFTRFAAGSEPTVLTLNYTDDVTVMVADAGRADMRLKWHLDETGNEHSKVLMVQPVRGADLAYAQAYAEQLAGDTKKGLGGLTVGAVSTIVLPQAVSEKSKSTRLTLEEKREVFREDDLPYFSLTDPTTPMQTMTVGDLDEDTDKFFVLVRDQRNTRQYVNMLEGEKGAYMSYTGSAMEEIVKQVAGLRAIEGFEGITGFFALTSQQVKVLQLREEGWKPALMALDEQLKDKAWIERLAQHVDISPEIRLDDAWGSKQAGYVGVLARHAKQATTFFAKLQKLLPEHPLVQLAQRLAAKSGAGATVERRVEQMVYTLNQFLDYRARVQLPGLTRLTDSSILRMALDAYPALRLLDFYQWSEAADRNPERAVNLFWQFVQLETSTDPEDAQALVKLGT